MTFYADSIPWLLAAPGPTVLQHAVLAARAYVALATSDEARTRTLGYVSVAYGAGFVLGPAVGGLLSQHSLRASAAVATAASAVSFVSLLVLLDAAPATATAGTAAPASPAAAAAGASASASASGGGLSAIWRSPALRGLLGVKALMSAALSLFHSTFALVAADRFGMDATGVGFLMSFAGALGIVAQAVLVPLMVGRFAEGRVVLAASAALAASFCGLALASTPAALYAVCVPLTLCSTVAMLLNTSQITRAAPGEVRGALVGIDMALGSGFRMVAPAVGALLLRSAGYWAMGASSAGLMAVATLLLALEAAGGGDAGGAPAGSKKSD
jgi:predicted MFS family arabinose efflux permease